MKKILSVMLCIILFTSLLPINIFANKPYSAASQIIIEGTNKLNVGEKTELKAYLADSEGNMCSSENGSIYMTVKSSNPGIITVNKGSISRYTGELPVKGDVFPYNIIAIKPGKTVLTFIHREYRGTFEIEVAGDMQISISNAMSNANGIKTKYIDAMRDDKLSINITNVPDGAVTEIDVVFDKPENLLIGEQKEVPAIQTEATGKVISYEIPIKGLKQGTVKVTASLKGEEKSDTAEIVIRSPRVFSNDLEVIFKNAAPYIENKRMFVSAEEFFPQVGGSAQENGQTVAANQNGIDFLYIADAENVKVNDAPATVKNIPTIQATADGETIYIPLRFTAENYNGYVQWKDEEYAAYITDDERSAYISNVKKYCYDYPEGEKTLYSAQQDAYDQLINNELYLSYWFMKEYSELDTSSFDAFVTDLGKKGIINATAMTFNGEWKDRLWQMLKASALKDYSSLTDGVDEVEKEKYKDALKLYIDSTHEKNLNDEIVDVIDNALNPLKEAASSVSTAVKPLKLDLKISNNADDLKETRKLMNELGVNGTVSNYSNEVDNLLAEFDTLDVVGKITNAADYAFIIKNGVSDMISVFGNYNALGKYVDELDDMANNESLPAALRQAANELKAEISGNMEEVIEAPLMRVMDEVGKKVTGDVVSEIAGSIGSGVAGQILAGVSIAAFIGNVTAGVDEIIKNISYTQMWGFLQVSESENLKEAVSAFNRLYKNEADINEVYKAAEEVETAYNRLHNYRLQGEQTYKYLQSGEYAIIDLQKLADSEEDVSAATEKIKMLNEISFK